jgi:Fur family zinc uptake transcriptional regulator
MVWTEHRPVRAYDLLDRLRETRGRAAPPTIYRALDFLRDQGLVHRIESLNAYIGCGSPLSQHSGQFLICRECSAVAELDDPAIEKLIKKRANDAGFQVVGQTIEITGLCPQCSGGDESSSPGSENALSEHA